MASPCGSPRNPPAQCPNRQTDRQTDRQTARQTDRQTDRQSDLSNRGHSAAGSHGLSVRGARGSLGGQRGHGEGRPARPRPILVRTRPKSPRRRDPRAILAQPPRNPRAIPAQSRAIPAQSRAIPPQSPRNPTQSHALPAQSPCYIPAQSPRPFWRGAMGRGASPPSVRCLAMDVIRESSECHSRIIRESVESH